MSLEVVSPVTERTLCLIKPGGVARGLSEKEVIEVTGLQMVKKHEIKPDYLTASVHYKEHLGKERFDRIVRHLTSGKVLVLVLEGDKAVERLRQAIGSVDKPLTLRGRFHGERVEDNAIHGSDSVEAAKEEIKLWF